MPIHRPPLAKVLFALLKMFLTLSITMSVAFVFRVRLVPLLNYPLYDAGFDPSNILRVDGPIESIKTTLTLSFYVGLMLALPLFLYFLAQLFLPVLTRRPQNILTASVAIGFLFFLGGVVLGFLYLVPATLRWLFADPLSMYVMTGWPVRYYYSLVLYLCFGTGLVCEMPVLLITAGPLELATSRSLRSNRLYGYSASLILGSVFCPTSDVVMLFLFAAPIALLFEASIWLLFYIERR